METAENEEIVKERCRFFRPGPPIALLMFAQAVSATVLTDLIAYRTCLISLNITHTECFMLRTNASSPEVVALEAKIDPYASMIIMAKSLIESILPAILSVFLGPWSDRGGRRPLLLAGLTGFTIMYVMLSFLCNWNVSPWYLVVPSIPAYMMGGFCAIILAAICHISDTTGEKDRTMRLAWLYASILIGVVLGIFAGPVLYTNWGYTSVFSAASICCFSALIYTYFCIPETVKDASKESICGLFKISFVKELVTSSMIKRAGFHRSVVWMGIFIIAICIMIVEGELSIAYLFTRERLGWDVQHFSYVSGAGVLLNIAGVLCGVSLLSRILGLSDTVVAGIALTSALGGAIARSLATETWHMYLASCIGMLSGVAGPVMRSIISKSVPAQDIGKVFSLTASLETLSPLAGAPLYTLIYSHYLPPFYPAPVYLLSASLYIMLILSVLRTEVLMRKSRNESNVNYVPLTHEE